MGRYLIRRVLQVVLVVFGVSTLMFGLLRLSGDPVYLFVDELSTPAQVADMRERLGFNQPLVVQYVQYVGKAVTGDFGDSLRYREPALGLVLQKLPATI